MLEIYLIYLKFTNHIYVDYVYTILKKKHLKALYSSDSLLLVKMYFTIRTLLQSPTSPSYHKNGDERLTCNSKTKPRIQVSAPSSTQHGIDVCLVLSLVRYKPKFSYLVGWMSSSALQKVDSPREILRKVFTGCVRTPRHDIPSMGSRFTSSSPHKIQHIVLHLLLFAVNFSLMIAAKRWRTCMHFPPQCPLQV